MALSPEQLEQQLWAIKSDFGAQSTKSLYVRFFDGRAALDGLRQWAKEFYPCDSG